MDLRHNLEAELQFYVRAAELDSAVSAILPIVERAVAAERERCAEVAEDYDGWLGPLTVPRIAAAIRALPPSAGNR